MTNPKVASILLKVDQLLDQLLGKQVEKPKPEPEPKPSADAVREKAIADAMDEIRKLLQRTGAAFGAGATLLLAGLGYAQLHEVFPLPAHNHWRTAFAAGIGALLAVAGAVLLAGVFFRAQRRILITPAEKDDDFQKPDQKIKDEIYARVAVEENAPSLDALELRARRFERMALVTSDKGLRVELETEAARVTRAYRWAMVFSAARVLERRSRDAFKSSTIWAGMAALGIVLAFGAADYSKGERDKVALFKSCQEAIKLGAVDACDSVRAPLTTEQTKEKAKNDRKAKKAERAALAKAHRTFRNTSKPLLARLQACSKVLSSTTETAQATTAAVLNACLRLMARS